MTPKLQFLLFFAFLLFSLFPLNKADNAKVTNTTGQPKNKTFITLSKFKSNDINILHGQTKSFRYFPLKQMDGKQSQVTILANPISEMVSGEIDLSVTDEIGKTIFLCDSLVSKPCVFNWLEAKGKKYFFNFACRPNGESCNAKVNVLEGREIRLEPEEAHIFRFIRANAEIFNLTIPTKTSFQRMVISIRYSKNDHISKYSFSPQIKCSSDIKENCVTFTMANRLVILINNKVDLPFENLLSLQIEARKKSKTDHFEIEYKFFQDESEIDLISDMNDAIGTRLFNAYKVKLIEADQKKNLNFHLKNLFGGNKMILILKKDKMDALLQNPTSINDIIKTQTSSFIDNVDYGKDFEQVLIHDNIDPEGYLHFIITYNPGCYVFALTNSGYVVLPMRVGIMEKIKLTHGQLRSYELQFEPSKSSPLFLDVSISHGNANIYIGECKGDCMRISDNDLINDSSLKKHSSTDNERSIMLESKCNHTSVLGLCSYVVVFEEVSELSHITKLQILPRQGSSTNNELPENHPVATMLEKEVWKYYRLWLLKESSLEKVVFSISAHDVEFFVSEDPNCLGEKSCSGTLKGDVENSVGIDVNLKKEELIYYVSIKAKKTTECVIFAEVIRKDRPQIMGLFDGIPFKSYLDKNKTGQMFTVEVNLKKKVEVHINLNANFEGLEMYVGKSSKLIRSKVGTKTAFSSFILMSKDGLITIKPSMKEYKEKAYYYVWVTYKGDVGKKLNSEIDTSFEIMFSTQHNYKTLQSNVPFYDKMQSEERKIFKFFVNPSEEELILTKFLMRGSMNTLLNQKELKMIVSPTPFGNLTLSNIANLTKLFTNSNESPNSFYFNHEILKVLCQKYQKIQNFCTLYVSLENLGTEELFYGLTVNIKGQATEVSDGKEISVPLVDSSELSVERVFYYRIKSFNKTLTLFSEGDYGTKYTLSVAFMNSRSPRNLKNDQITSNIYRSTFDTLHSIVLESSDLKQNCENSLHCLLVVKINVQVEKEIASLLKYTKNELIYLIVTQNMFQVKEGKHFMMHLKAKGEKFLSYCIEDFLKKSDNEAITISITPLTGTFFLSVDEANDTFISFPEKFKGKFFTSYSHMTIHKNQLSTDKKVNKLIIGISSETGGKFILDVIENNLISLKNDYPLQVIVNPQETHGFEIANYWYIKGLEVKFIRESGEGTIGLLKIPENKLLDDIMLDEPIISETISDTSNFVTLSIDSSHPAFCWGCVYFVTIVAKTFIKGTISASEKGGNKPLLMNSATFDNLGPNQIGTYSLDIPIDRRCEVILSSYSGEPNMEAAFGDYYSAPSAYDLVIDHQMRGVQKLIITEKDLAETYENHKKSMNLTQKQLESYFNSGHITLYIRISNTASSSNFSMEVIEGSHYRIIREGLITYSQVNASQFVVFMLEKLELTRINSTKEEYFHLFIQKLTGNLNLKLQVFFREMGKKFEDEIDISKTISTMNSLELQLPNKIGTFFFTIQNLNKNLNVELNMIVSSNKVLTIPYEGDLAISLAKKNIKKFETFLPGKGVLSIELKECHGGVDLKRSNSYKGLVNGSAVEQFKSIQGADQINYFKVTKPEPFYFFLQGEGRKFNNAQLSLRFWNSVNDIPHKNLVLGSSGKIEYYVKGNEIFLTFLPIYCPKCKPLTLNSTKIKYDILVGNTLFDIDSVGKCRLGVPKIIKNSMEPEEIVNIKENLTLIEYDQIDFTKKKGPKVNKTVVHSFEDYEQLLKEDGIDHYITIRAQVKDYSFQENNKIRILEPFDLFYKTIEVNFKPSNDTINQELVHKVDQVNKELNESNTSYKKILVIAIIVIVVLIFCVLGAFFYDRKKKRRNFMHFSFDKDKNKLVKLSQDESREEVDIEMENKDFESFNKALKKDNKFF